jgi:tRNA nucleotidyltransferase (CCA-adding enzyme)
MHMLQQPRQPAILAAGLPVDQLASALRLRLAPEGWPLPLGALPAGTVLVGGAVRDALLGRLAPRPDLDLVVPGDAVALARELARQLGGAVVVLDGERSIARLVLQGWTIDLARRMGANLQQDLLRRDYTANAIALQLTATGEGREHPEGALLDSNSGGALLEPSGDLLDPSGGLEDLAAGRLRAISEANLLEDPLRLLRGVRLAWELDFVLEPTSLGWICQHGARLGQVAGERVLAELERLAVAPRGGLGLAQVVDTGLLASWGGELSLAGAPAIGVEPAKQGPLARQEAPAGKGAPASGAEPAMQPVILHHNLAKLQLEAAAERGLSEAETAWALPLARLASLLDGQSLARLKSSRRLQLSCQRLRHWWRRLGAVGGDPDGLPEEERLSLQRQLEGELPALALLLEAEWAPTALARWRDPADPLFHPRAPIDGATLQAQLALEPGPRLGQLLEHLTRERAFGRLPAQPGENAAETLIEARHWLSQGGVARHG